MSLLSGDDIVFDPDCLLLVALVTLDGRGELVDSGLSERFEPFRDLWSSPRLPECVFDSMMLACCARVLSRLVPVSGSQVLNDDAAYYTTPRSKRTPQARVDPQNPKNIYRLAHA